jgi:16S rRNA (guanine527-N7)-methyltransferase
MVTQMREYLESGLSALQITPPPQALAQFEDYARLLLEQNQVMNLTAIKEPDQVAILHFLDSAALLGAAQFPGKRVIDVGTGAGFPGLPLKLLEPSISLTLLDSLGKRVAWLSQLAQTLGVEGVSCLHARAEEQALEPGYRDAFDLATSRALAPLHLLCELCLPFVKVGGTFLAMKSTDCQEELSAAAAGIQLLGGRVESFYDYDLPHAQIRHRVVRIQKIAPTPKGYPRRWAKIQKAPLSSPILGKSSRKS